MIFDSYCESAVAPMSAIQESKYPLGLEGALMHVYENECNYNAMMKAVGISEMRYYQETGKDLFVNEAGAMGGFLNKAKEFFKKVIEKIKAMFKKLFMVISSYIGDDKKFVKKYRDQLLRVNMTDFEFEGYTFKGLKDHSVTSKLDKASVIKALKMEAMTKAVMREIDSTDVKKLHSNEPEEKLTADAINDDKEKSRGELIGKDPMDETEFREEFHEMIFGDKETLENISIREQLDIITNAKNNIGAVEKAQKEIEGGYNEYIKILDKAAREEVKTTKNPDGSLKGEKEIEAENLRHKSLNASIDVARSASNDITVMCGIIIDGIKKCNRQAKAICVKAINYKPANESFAYTGSNDIFAGVEII